MVTAEIALALPALVLVLGFAVSLMVAVGTRASCADAARAGARAAARGESEAVVVATVRRVLPRADPIQVERSGGLVTVRVGATPDAVIARLVLPSVRASATAADEVSS